MSKDYIPFHLYNVYRAIRYDVLNEYNAFELFYNEDNGKYSYPYEFEGYIDNVDVLNVSTSIFNNVIDGLKKNRISKNDQIFLLKIIIPECVESFGKNNIKTLKYYSDHFPGNKEYEKTIENLLKIRNLLLTSFNSYINPKSKELTSFKIKPGKVEIVKRIITQLTFKLYFIDEEINSIDDFMKILTSKNIKNDSLKAVHLKMNNNQIKYIFERLRIYFHELSFANIERSQLFIKKSGEKLLARDISSAGQNVYQCSKQSEIDSIFADSQQIS